MTPTQIARLAVYLLAALVGALFAVYGMLHGDWQLITTGLGLLGTGSLAGANVPSTPATTDLGAHGTLDTGDIYPEDE